MERKDWANLVVAIIAAAISLTAIGLTLYQMNSPQQQKVNQLTDKQLTQLEGLLNNTAIGFIKDISYSNTTIAATSSVTIPHGAPPVEIIAKIDNDPSNGDWWIIVHKPYSEQHNNDADRYYPTPAKLGSGQATFRNVVIGVPGDTERKRYPIGLYYCDSVDNARLDAFIKNPVTRKQGIASVPSGCSVVQHIAVSRLGP